MHICDLCGKQLKNKAGLAGHRQRSHVERDKQSHYGKAGNIVLQEKVALGEISLSRSHTEEMKQHLSKIACERLAKHSKYSKNVEYKPGVILESSYEVKCAEILDKLGVEWIKVRQGFEYNKDGKIRRYIPDFYLPKFNLYLDPKNDYLIKLDEQKIKSAMEMNGITVVVISKDELTEAFFKTLLPNFYHEKS